MDLHQEDELLAMKSPGEYLKSARMARQWKINDLVQRTKLPVFVVEALERDDYDAIEAKLFIRGYLRLYARTVGAREDEAVARFESLLQEKGQLTSPLMGSNTLSDSVTYHPPIRMGFSNPRRWLSVVIIAGLLLLAGMWWYRTQSTHSTFLKNDLFTLSTSVENKVKENVLTTDSTTLKAMAAVPEKAAEKFENTPATAATVNKKS